MICRTVKELTRAIKNKKMAVLPVWDITDNDFVQGGACLNLGEGKYSYVGKENWSLIRNNIVSAEDKSVYLKDFKKYEGYFNNNSCKEKKEMGKKTFFVLTSREGTEMLEPVIFNTKEKAQAVMMDEFENAKMNCEREDYDFAEIDDSSATFATFGDWKEWQITKCEVKEKETYTTVINIKKNLVAHINSLLELHSEEGNLQDNEFDKVVSDNYKFGFFSKENPWTFTAKFPNGREADIKVCCGSMNFYIDPVLFNKCGGEECVLSPDMEVLEGEYTFDGKDGNEYVVKIEAA